MQQQVKVLLSEFIGTYFLVFCGTGAIVIDTITGGTVGHSGIAITFGLVVMVLIYALGSVSGAHINPAVSIGFALTDVFSARRLIPYIIAQMLGAILASLTLWYLFPSDTSYLGATLPLESWEQALILEVLLAYLLMFVILFVSQNPSYRQHTAIAVGGVILLEAMFAGAITGASMNPARSLAPALVSGNMNALWIYMVAPVLGAIMATFTWKILKS